MKKIFIKSPALLILMVMALSQLGCAATSKEISFFPIENSHDWIKKDSIVIFNSEQIRFEAYPVRLGDHATSWGPPLLPIIPVTAKINWGEERYQINFKITSEVKTATIDLAQIQLILSSGVNYLPTHFQEVNQKGHINEMKDHIITVENGTRYFYVAFNVPYDTIDNFIIQFGDVHIGDEQLTVPSLQYTKTTKHLYAPLLIGH